MFNVTALYFFSQCICWLPTRHFVGIVVGSAVASGAAILCHHRNETQGALGLTGIVAGTAAVAACLVPMQWAEMFFIIKGPLWVLIPGETLLYLILMVKRVDTGIGHASHVGRSAWSALYYGLFLRRYGGVATMIRAGAGRHK
jgi:hypothetical protein